MRTLRRAGCSCGAEVAVGVTTGSLDPFIAHRTEVRVVHVAVEQVTLATLVYSHGENVAGHTYITADLARSSVLGFLLAR